MTLQLVQNKHLRGTLPAIASKSYAHRLLMAAALSDGPTEVRCATRSADILATVRVLTALGAGIKETAEGFRVTPVPADPAARPQGPLLDCGESGTTERFILPIACALGVNASLTGSGRLPERPLSPLYEELADHGITMSPQGTFPLSTSGRLAPAAYTLAANVSSQFVGGLLFALTLLEGTSTLTLTGKIESAPYIDMTLDVLALFGAKITRSEDGRCFEVTGSGRLVSPGHAAVEGDWSNAAFWLAAGALSGDPQGVTVTGLLPLSRQGDRAVLDILRRFGASVTVSDEAVTVRPGRLRGITVDAAQIPDLVPVLAVVAAAAEGTTRFVNAGRLRIKESDRLSTTAAMLKALKATVSEEAEGLTVSGGRKLFGGTVEGANDHRIVMSAAVAAALAKRPVTIRGAEAVKKSYPAFFDDMQKLGGAGYEILPRDEMIARALR